MNSSTKLSRLNSDLLDGKDSSYFQQRLTDTYVIGIDSCPAGTSPQANITLTHSYGGSDYLYKLCAVG